MIRWPSLPSLSERDRRTVGLGAIAIALLLLAGKGIPAYRTLMNAVHAARDEVELDSRRADDLVASVPRLRDSLRARSARAVALAPAIVAGDTPGAAAAALASLVTDAAVDGGVSLGALEPRADTETASRSALPGSPSRHALLRVSVHGVLTGDVVGIGQFLGELEDGPALLAIQDLSISQPDPAAPTDRMEVLHAEFTVRGLAVAPGASPWPLRDARTAPAATLAPAGSQQDRSSVVRHYSLLGHDERPSERGITR